MTTIEHDVRVEEIGKVFYYITPTARFRSAMLTRSGAEAWLQEEGNLALLGGSENMREIDMVLVLMRTGFNEMQSKHDATKDTHKSSGYPDAEELKRYELLLAGWEVACEAVPVDKPPEVKPTYSSFR